MNRLASLLAAAFVLAACGSKADEAAASPEPAGTSAATGEPAEPAAAPGDVSPVQTASAAPAAQEIGPPVWVVDRAKSTLKFTGVQTGKPFEGGFGEFDASIVFDPSNLAASKVAVEVATASAKTGDRQRDDALPGADWFAAKTFPTATFETSEIAPAGDGAFEARGKLTMRDVTRDIVLPFSVAISGDRAVADGAVTLIRTDFGVGQGEFATGQWVGLEVKVDFHIEATR